MTRNIVEKVVCDLWLEEGVGSPWSFNISCHFSALASGHLQTRNGPPLDVEPSIVDVFSCFSGKAGTKVDAETRKIQRCALWSLLPSHFISQLSFKTAAERTVFGVSSILS